MGDVLGLENISDVVVLAIISNAFWLALFFICVGFFRSEIRTILSSLSSVSIAGSHFELGDKALTLKSYAILSNIFLDLLCTSSNNDKLVGVFSEVNAQQLGKFAVKYLIEAKKEEINYPLIRNIAYIVGQRGSLQDSLSLYNFLIEKAPDDRDILHNKGLVLLAQNPSEAKKLYENLMLENPGVLVYRYNYALTNILLGTFDEAVKDLVFVIKEGYRDPDMFLRSPIKKLARVKPEEYKKLLDLIQEDGQSPQEINNTSTEH